MSNQLALGLAVARTASGVVGLFAPRLLHRLSGLEPDGSPAAVAYTRFFSTRAIALGIGYLVADESTRRDLDRIGLIADGYDTLWALIMVSGGSLRARTAAWLVTATGSAAAIDIMSATRSRGTQ